MLLTNFLMPTHTLIAFPPVFALPLSSPPPSPLCAVIPGPPESIEAIETTQTSATLEVQLSLTGTPPLIVIVELTSHPELMCCSNKTTYTQGDSVRFDLEGLSEGTTYRVTAYARNLAGRGSGEQKSFSTG